VAEDHRLPDPHRAEAAVVEVVQIRAADAAGADADLDVARPEVRDGRRFDPKVVRGVDDDGERHGADLSRDHDGDVPTAIIASL
jgi:hypothetical protein